MPLHFRQAAAQKARELWATHPVFMDTETTGLKDTAEIVEISIIDHNGAVLFDSLVRPRDPIPQDVIRVHGITNDMVQDAPTWLRIWPEVEALLANRSVGIYNADFDLRMMQQSHRQNSMSWRTMSSQVFCIMKLYSDFYGGYKWQKLEAAGQQCGIELPNTHRAKEDTLLARAIFQYMVNST